MTESASSLNYRQAQLADLCHPGAGSGPPPWRHRCRGGQVSEGVGQAVSVRLGEVETIEYTGDKGVGVTVSGPEQGHASSSGFFCRRAGRHGESRHQYRPLHRRRPVCRPGRSGSAGDRIPDLSLCHPWSLSVEDAIELARATEAAGQAVDAG